MKFPQVQDLLGSIAVLSLVLVWLGHLADIQEARAPGQARQWLAACVKPCWGFLSGPHGQLPGLISRKMSVLCSFLRSALCQLPHRPLPQIHSTISFIFTFREDTHEDRVALPLS